MLGGGDCRERGFPSLNLSIWRFGNLRPAPANPGQMEKMVRGPCGVYKFGDGVGAIPTGRGLGIGQEGYPGGGDILTYGAYLNISK